MERRSAVRQLERARTIDTIDLIVSLVLHTMVEPSAAVVKRRVTELTTPRQSPRVQAARVGAPLVRGKGACSHPNLIEGCHTRPSSSLQLSGLQAYGRKVCRATSHP